MKIISVINQKGGVGKTSTSVNLSYRMALNGIKTLLIDLDPQAHSSSIFYPSNEDSSQDDRHVGMIFNTKKDLSDCINSAYLMGDMVENLYLMRSTIHLALTAEEISGRIHRERILSRKLQPNISAWGCVIIDCPPTLGVLSINAICASDSFIIPVTYSKYALDGMRDLLSVINEVRYGSKMNIRILKNNRDERNSVTNTFIDDDLSRSFSELAMKTIIRKCEAINQAQMRNQTVFDYSPKSTGAEDFALLTKEIESEIDIG